MGNNEQRTDIQTAIIGLPIKLGGLGVLSHKETQSFAREASLALSRNELLKRQLTTRNKMVELAEQHVSEGGQDEDNPYKQVGPLPYAADDFTEHCVKQKELTLPFMQLKQQRLLETMTIDQQANFVENMSALLWMQAIPKGNYRSLTDKQLSANLNMLMLRKRLQGQLCQCGDPNSIQHYAVCRLSGNTVSQTMHYRHNWIRDAIVRQCNLAEDKTATSEPRVFPPNHQNNQRADFLICAKGGHAQTHEYYGKFDIMAKAIFSPHTLHARQQARLEEQQNGNHNIISRCRKEIQAALQVGYAQKEYNYRFATMANIRVMPLIVSAGGVLHSKFYKFLKKVFPDGDQRRWLQLDMAVVLARGRGQIYSCATVIAQEAVIV